MHQQTPPSCQQCRVMACLRHQRKRSLRCPAEPRLDGKIALVTGATGGIGEVTARGLLARGALVLAPCRNPARAYALRGSLDEHGDRLIPIPLRLDDVTSVPSCVSAVAAQLNGRRIDILLENAGVWPQRYAETAQGIEIAFGTNVLGHFALRRALMSAQLLDDQARVVMVTGDIYVLQADCTPTYRWWGPVGGVNAYCRSKLGNLWIARELQRRDPSLTVTAVHPGVVASNLAGSSKGVIGWGKRQLLISPSRGAETSLFCATQPDVVAGGYYHNMLGHVRLRAEDPALNSAGASRLWDDCERLSERATIPNA